MNSNIAEIFNDLPVGQILTFLGGVVSAMLGYQATRLKAKEEKEATVPAGWRDLTSEMKSWFEDRTEDMEKRIASMEKSERVREGYELYVSDAIAQQRLWGTENQVSIPQIMTFPEWRNKRESYIIDPDAADGAAE